MSSRQATLEIDAWPDGVPVQLHVSHGDPWHDPSSLAAFVEWVPTELVELHEYPNCGHLFTDEELEEYDQAAASRLLSAVLNWLDVVRC